MVNWILIGAGVGIGITVLGSILGWAVFPIVVRNQIDESITLVEGSEQFERWVNIPQALDFKVYIFNVTNAEAVQNGAIPSVQQIGPYVYSQYRKKTVQEFSEDRVFVTYTQQQTYFFNARASAPLTENDRIVVLNMAMNSIIQTAPENQLNLVNLGIGQVFDYPTSMFVTTTPREYLFDGVPFCLNRTGLAPGALCFTVAQQESSSLRVMEDGSIRFSFFYEKNSTHDGVFKVHTGLHDTQRITEIQEWEGSPVLSHWLNPIVNTTSVCNMINGTDSASFPPHLSAGGRLQIFSSDICRSVNIFFDQRTTYEGITGFRFVTTDDFLNQIGPQYSTECFCIDSIPNVPKDSNGCLLPGALDLSVCRGAPVVMTLPHMTGAHANYSTVNGLAPNPDEYQIFVEIEPNTGYPLRGGRRVQFNMFLKPVPSIDITQNLPTVLMPALWVDEGISLNDDMVQMLNDQLLTILLVLDIIHWLLFSVGLALFIGMMIWYFVRRRNNRNRRNVQPTTSENKS